MDILKHIVLPCTVFFQVAGGGVSAGSISELPNKRPFSQLRHVPKAQPFCAQSIEGVEEAHCTRFDHFGSSVVAYA